MFIILTKTLSVLVLALVRSMWLWGMPDVDLCIDLCRLEIQLEEILARFVTFSQNNQIIIEKCKKLRMFQVLSLRGKNGMLTPVRDLYAENTGSVMAINCMHFLPIPGQGILYGTNTGELVLLQ